MLKTLLPLLLLLLTITGYTQQQNSWQEYLSFTNATKVAITDTKIFCATEGGLFYFNTSDNSLNKMTRINGLSDFGIRTISWSEQHNILVVAYNNSNIDLIHENTVLNLSDIKRKQMTGDMNIYNITILDDEAYLACGFGIVTINLIRKEIKDTWFIGPNGSSIVVNDVDVFRDEIFAATNNGLYKATYGSQNLADYRNWETVSVLPNTSNRFNHLAVHAGSLIVNSTSGQQNQDAMYRLSDNGWAAYLPQIQHVYDAQVYGNYLAIGGSTASYIIDETHTVAGLINSYPFINENITDINPRSVAIDNSGTIWIADYYYGLVRFSQQQAESFIPKGPTDNLVFSLIAQDENLWVIPGGRTDSWSNTWQAPRFHKYIEKEWITYNNKTFPGMEGFFDIIDLAVSPSNPEHIFAASWGGGLLEFLDGELINRYTNLNSPLQSALPQQPNEPFVRIGGIAFDSEGALWITNSDVDKNLLKLNPSGEWESLSMPEISNYNIGKILVTQNDDKWIQVPRGNDVYIINKNASEKKRLLVTSYFNNGRQEITNRMNDIYSMVEDRDGNIWLGTSKGVAVYNNPWRIWEHQNVYAIQPGLDLKDGLYHPLLETETITAIAVDGANRKWIGTRNSGVYLISESGEQEILHFTEENSPLLSNNITALAINQSNGEVFIGTSEGLISFQGDAVEGNSTYADVYVYPNPVRETYDGPVTIMGLVEDTDLKITDINGNLVFQSTSLGGQATWDGKNLNGNRVKTGVYLIFCTDRYGEKTHIEKLLFIH